MIVLFRTFVLLILIEALFYFLLRIYWRSVRREALEKEWDSDHPDQAGPSEERSDFVERSMEDFDRRLVTRLIALVFVLPTLAVMGIIYWINWQ